MSAAQGHIVVLGAQPEWLSGLRGPMIRDFLRRGYRVTAIGAEEIRSVRDTLEGWGAGYVVVPLSRAGLNPLRDLRSIIALYRAFRRLAPDLVLAYTVKPIVYGLPAARLAGVSQRFAMITGRGYAFLEGREISRRLARRLATVLYRHGLAAAHGVMFHNEDDRALFLCEGMTDASTSTIRIWGSGIDLSRHAPAPFIPPKPGAMRFLMIGRLIRDKGIREFLDAARLVKQSHPYAVFRLAGPADPSPNGVSADEIARWQSEGIIDYLGPLDDVRDEIANCHVLVLPSYAEGLPRSVLEAMAAGRAVITTTAPGCSDTVEDGKSGLLVPVRDTPALATAMTHCIENPDFVRAAGELALGRAQAIFDVHEVNLAIAQFLGLRAAAPGNDTVGG